MFRHHERVWLKYNQETILMNLVSQLKQFKDQGLTASDDKSTDDNLNKWETHTRGRF